MDNKKIPYKIYLNEDEMPKQWYNVRADMKNKPAPLLNPATGKPVTLEELSHVFCTELAKQELDDTTAYSRGDPAVLQNVPSGTVSSCVSFRACFADAG